MGRTVRTNRTTAVQHRQPRGVRFLWLVSIALLISSCSAKYHLNRAIAKDPSIVLNTTVRVDTTIITKSVAVRDTIKIKEVDTIQIVKNGVVVDIRRQYDTIEVDVQCPPDTIRVYQEVEVPTYVPEKKEKNIGKGALLGFIFALVIVKITGAVLRK